MDEEQEPAWADLAGISEAIARQLEPGIQASQVLARQLEPIISAFQAMARQLEPIVQANEVMARQLEPMVQAAAQFARAGGWPVPPFQRQMLRAVETALGGALAPLHPFMRDANVVGPVGRIRLVALPGEVTVTESAAAAVKSPAGQETVQNPGDHQSAWSLGRIFALVLAAIVTAGLLAVPGPDRGTVEYYLAVTSFAMSIAVLIWSKQK